MNSHERACPDLLELRADRVGEQPEHVVAHLRECESCRAVALLDDAFAAPAALSPLCDEILALLTVSPMVTLAETDRARVESHVTACSGCLASMAELAVTDDGQQWGDDAIGRDGQPWGDARPRPPRSSRGPLVWGAVATAVVLAAAAVLIVMRTGQGTAPAQPTPTAVRPTSVHNATSQAPAGSRARVPRSLPVPARGVGFWRPTELLGLSGVKATHPTPSAFVFDGAHVSIRLPAAKAGNDPLCRGSMSQAGDSLCTNLPARWSGNALEYRVGGVWRTFAYLVAGQFRVSSRVAVGGVESVASWRFDPVLDLRGLSAADQQLVAGFAAQHRRYWPPSRLAALSSDRLEVIARLVEFSPQAHCGTLAISATMKYRVETVVRGTYPHRVLYVNHLCPELSRASALGPGGGSLKRFSAGDSHRLILRKVGATSPVAAPSVIDVYRGAPLPRYRAENTSRIARSGLSLGNKGLVDVQTIVLRARAVIGTQAGQRCGRIAVVQTVKYRVEAVLEGAYAGVYVYGVQLCPVIKTGALYVLRLRPPSSLRGQDKRYFDSRRDHRYQGALPRYWVASATLVP